MKSKSYIPASFSILCTLLILTLITGCNSSDGPKFTDQWQQYRGPNSDGVSTSKVQIKPWTEGNEPSPVWKKNLGSGFSGISIAGKQLIVAFGDETSEILGSFDRLTGQENWRCNIGKLYKEEFGDGPRGTPAVDGNQAFIYNSWGHLYCVDITTGKMVWKSELADQFKLPMIPPKRGFTTSPLVVDDKVIIYTAGNDNSAFMGLNRNTGEIVWKTDSVRATYSSPSIAVINGVKQILFTTTKVIEVDGKRKGLYEVISLNSDGKELWKGPGLPGVIAMPIFIAPDKVFVSSQTEAGCLLFQVKFEGDNLKTEELWKSKNMRNHFNSSVYYNGNIFGFSNATLECLDAKTSKRKWRKRGLGKGSLIVVDGKLIVLSDKGKLIIAKATAEKYQELAKTRAMKGKSWTTPTFADGFLYLRNLKEMVCYDLTK